MAFQEDESNPADGPAVENDADLNATEDESDEEDECRVCRGPAEAGRPLFAPCKCSGSIGLVHQDCLMSWLAVTRGDGRCELCKTKFVFDPQYAENAPDRLPAHEVLLGLSSRTVSKWLPLGIRFLIAASLWLMVAPLITAYLYYGWMHRPSSIMTRWKRELITADMVSGAVVAAVIIISFLSLMSFADFLRVHWQQPPPRRGGAEGNNDADLQQQQRRNDVANGFGAADNNDNNNNNNEGGIDEAIVNHLRIQQNRTANHQEWNDDDDLPVRRRTRYGQRSPYPQQADRSDGVDEVAPRRARNPSDNNNEEGNDNRMAMDTDHNANDALRHGTEAHPQPLDVMDLWHRGRVLDPQPRPLEEHNYGDNNDGGSSDDADAEDEDDDDDNEIDPDDLDEEFEEEDHNDDDDDLPPLVERNMDLPPLERPFDPMDPVLQDDQVELEINVALDELLGLRGPLSTLIRNLLWLLAFNATYLGIFAFVPRTIGSIVYSGLFNTTACSTLLHQLPYVSSENSTDVTILSVISDLKEESARLNTSFRLPDLATVTLGYLSIAIVIVLVRYGWVFTHKIRNRLNSEGGDTVGEREQGEGGAVIDNNRLRHERVRDGMHFGGGFDDGDAVEPPEAAASVAVTMALDATVAVVKVGILLFLKMFLLPLLLGLWLDTSTMSLFGNTLSDRILYAGRDLFSFILLHWVAGITFMLLVTVFLLQLREVAHPDLLARLIRPQEPQPDLLGNLMHESVSTHMKRMFLSLAIYAPLLTILVSVPVKMFVASGISNYVPFYQLHFWHIVMPQMQIPLELIVFHLTMLALLEKYKNTIGELQHHWLVFMCRRMGLTDHILPQSIDKFRLIGTKEIFAPIDGSASTGVDQVDPFWYELAKKDSDLDDFVLSNIEKASSGTPTFLEGESKPNGDKVLSKSVNYILLPQQQTDDTKMGLSRTSSQNLLPTKIGRYRLCVRDASVIEFWGEVPGKEVARPPEGWDDLGAGGAFVQGRWAWGKERKSIVEGSVAQRTPFRATERQRRPFYLMLKVTVLLFFSWFAITITVLGIVSAPLAVGRSIYFLFRVPQEYVHDPLACCIGGCLFFPMSSTFLSTFTADRDDIGRFARLARWASHFHLPPRQKFLVFMESVLLWFAVAPMALGVSYELIAVKRGQWFSRDEGLIDFKSMCLCWMVGTVVLNSWAFLAYFSVFTREFWANIGNGILEPPPDENDGGVDRARARPNGREAQGVNGEPQRERLLDRQRVWQGKEGRVARFFKVWKAVFFEWKWDAIDHVVLLGDFALPISKQSVAALVGSSFSFLALVYVTEACLEIEGASIITIGSFRMVAFRICLALHVLVQLCFAFRAPLESWFHAAHKVARDDRYLIGEVLMNYSPEGYFSI